MKVKTRHLWWLLAPVLVAVVVVGIQLFVHAQQKHAIEEIERLGGRVLTTHGEPGWLRWLTGTKSLELFEQATVVNLSETKITDSELVHLRRLSRLERLNLSETRITDNGLAQLGGLTELKALDLSGTKISGQGLKHLHDLSHLEFLYLSGTQFTDGDVHQLFGFKKLRELDLSRTDVSDEGVKTIMRQIPDVVVKQ